MAGSSTSSPKTLAAVLLAVVAAMARWPAAHPAAPSTRARRPARSPRQLRASDPVHRPRRYRPPRPRGIPPPARSRSISRTRPVTTCRSSSPTRRAPCSMPGPARLATACRSAGTRLEGREHRRRDPARRLGRPPARRRARVDDLRRRRSVPARARAPGRYPPTRTPWASTASSSCASTRRCPPAMSTSRSRRAARPTDRATTEPSSHDPPDPGGRAVSCPAGAAIIAGVRSAPEQPALNRASLRDSCSWNAPLGRSPTRWTRSADSRPSTRRPGTSGCGRGCGTSGVTPSPWRWRIARSSRRP